MIRKIFAVITLILSILAFCTVIFLGAIMAQDYIKTSNTPGTSGVDYLHFALYPVFFGVVAVFGALNSGICLKITENKAAKIIALVLLSVFVCILLILPVFIAL